MNESLFLFLLAVNHVHLKHSIPLTQPIDRVSSRMSASKKQKLDVPTLTDEEKRVIMIQYEKENETEDSESLFAEYLKFMAIKIREKDADDKRAAPSNMIDEMWHAHVLSTKEYFAFCKRHNDGDYLHHDPSMVNTKYRYRWTLTQYRELFHESPKDATIWPPLEVGYEYDGYDSDGDSDPYGNDPGCG